MPDAIVLAIHADRANAILDGTALFEHRTVPPKRLPARAYLAVVEERAIVGECDLGAPTRRSAKGWALPVTKPRRYRAPRPLSDFGLAKIPRSLQYTVTSSAHTDAAFSASPTSSADMKIFAAASGVTASFSRRGGAGP